MPHRITIRPATLRDLPTLVRHRRGMFLAMGVGTAAQLDDHDRRYRVWARRLLRSAALRAFIATVDGEPVASGAVWLRDQQPSPVRPSGAQPYLLSMFTEPAWRGRGIATRLVRAARRWCRDEGHSHLSLHASRMGRRVYERLGFARTREYRIDL